MNERFKLPAYGKNDTRQTDAYRAKFHRIWLTINASCTIVIRTLETILGSFSYPKPVENFHLQVIAHA
ncbi:MAG: hypothetical protein LBS00_06785, partial [Synergistaceae bacterium]|nr:hypothetical protein [Synergistaceae bacterium]